MRERRWRVILRYGVRIAQCGLIWVGLYQMRAASECRDRQMDNQHAETMDALALQLEALSILIGRVDRRHGETP